VSNDPGISAQELHAYIDGELPPERAARVAKRIEEDSVLAMRVNAFSSDKRELEQLYAEELRRPVPEEWLRRIDQRTIAVRRTDARGNSSRRAVAFAIAAGLLLILGATLLSRYALPGDDAIIAEALAARQQTMLPQHVFTGDVLSAPEKRNEILTTLLDMPLKVPDLERMGYRLAEIRVYNGVPGGNAVGLNYRDDQMHEFTLYLRHPSSPARVDLYQREGLRICIWQDDVLGTVMLGEMSAAAMARIASLSYSGLNL